MSESQVVTYSLDGDETVSIEITPIEGFVPVGVESVAGHVRRAVEPAIAAARVVLDQTRAMAPDTVQVKFGVKVTGTTSWLVAKAATEGNFEITLTWGQPSPG
ncbi:CU044_2847 family protein [Actinoplanes sp. NPDC049118]|uniref:CU044_2847 family protein n=1 Tax=Actinoplanes sp. NPDC049118 TaxID=3155769 RepID=UPI0033EEF009